MAEDPTPKEPAKLPAATPPIDDIIAEGSKEIGAQARAAVESIMSKGDFASSAQLRKWGPKGAKYFLKKLQERIAEASRPAPTEPSKTARTVTGSRRAPAKPARCKATKRKRAPVAMNLNWASQQHSRWSARRRAITFGILIAGVLLIGAAAFIRLWPIPDVALQELFQNRS